MGAHALKATLMERGMMNAWDVGAKYHLLHAVALVGIGAWARAAGAGAPGAALLGVAAWARAAGAGAPGAALLAWVTRLWVAGVILFSGSLYWLAVGGPRWLGPVTPLGGVAFMAGWLLVALVALRRPA